MKKAKIMLTAITVLAVVGGALAFKAEKLIPQKQYCTGVAVDNCPNLFATTRPFKDVPVGQNGIYYTNTIAPNQCPAVQDCLYATTDVSKQ